jgi:cystine transport system permease protein
MPVPHWLQLMLDSLPAALGGLVFTIPLTLLSFALGLTLGLDHRNRPAVRPGAAGRVVRFYVWVIRGTPLLVQLFVIFYGLPSIGILLDAFPAASSASRSTSAPTAPKSSAPSLGRCRRASGKPPIRSA